MRTERAAVLTEDPGLGTMLSAHRRLDAENRLTARTRSLSVGPWDVSQLVGFGADHIGFLVLEGVISRELVVADHVSAELLGRGDLIRPWQISSKDRLLPSTAEWTVLSPVRLAVLDRSFANEAANFPEVMAALLDRLGERQVRLATTQAISQLTRVDRRLLALFWHLAERWGRVNQDGILIPLALTHRILGQLVGARRPTVSSALTDLAARDELVRCADGSWLLRGEPPTPEATDRTPRARDLLRPARRFAARAAHPEPTHQHVE